jgi:hypothetical protein
MSTRASGATLAMAVLFLTTGAARANGTVDEALRAIAQDVKKYLDGRGESSVSVGQFRGTGTLSAHASAGPNLVRELTRQLTALKLTVQIQSNITLLGEYEEAEDEKTAKQVVILKIELREKRGKKTELEARFVKNQAALAVLLGLTVQIPPDANLADRNQEMKKRIDKPDAALADTCIYAEKKSPFSIEVLVAEPNAEKDGKHKAEDYKARVPKPKEGLAFVGISREEVYAVRLRNEADYDVAVDLRIDGLSMFSFSAERDPKTGQPAYRYVVVPKGRSVLIRGWFVTTDDSDEFLVTSYPKSAAAELNSTANLGTITALFHAAWPKKGQPPAGEPKNPDEFSQSADATGRGRRFQVGYEVVEYKVGVLRASISARYSK